ncbi:MAG TPA: 2-oxo acid dehydrogenase subunit E2, partial [Sorangium sp.]|nr:2-oxo acid dehydrogenase subunit E2 [Sorangium sp.]
MSTFNFKLPDIGEGVVEGEIVTWLIELGDVVSEDQPVVEVMTDKATVTITSPRSGKVVQLGGDEGEVIPVHSTLLKIELAGGAEEASSDDKAKADTEAGGGEGPAATA